MYQWALWDIQFDMGLIYMKGLDKLAFMAGANSWPSGLKFVPTDLANRATRVSRSFWKATSAVHNRQQKAWPNNAIFREEAKCLVGKEMRYFLWAIYIDIINVSVLIWKYLEFKYIFICLHSEGYRKKTRPRKSTSSNRPTQGDSAETNIMGLFCNLTVGMSIHAESCAKVIGTVTYHSFNIIKTVVCKTLPLF